MDSLISGQTPDIVTSRCVNSLQMAQVQRDMRSHTTHHSPIPALGDGRHTCGVGPAKEGNWTARRGAGAGEFGFRWAVRSDVSQRPWVSLT